ncbi:MAG: alpha-ketoglutarate-dependent dioxygenase AlkB [Actinomycetota bacterium]|nr:alpha-ketoglutarate-dependent dioxygenase AlkB [Actinomycetota bacterium]
MARAPVNPPNVLSKTAATPIRRGLALVRQPSLLGGGPPSPDRSFTSMRRTTLAGGAWVDHQDGWLAGDDTLFTDLVSRTSWNEHRRPMYDRVVDVPRLTATHPGDTGGHELLDHLADLLSARYGLPLDRVSLALYRDGADSVAPHGDRIGRDAERAVVASVSLGERRRFLLRPADGGGRTLTWNLGGGDLIVMGGTCQRTWRHAVPKAAGAGPRICVMFRHGPDAIIPGEDPG